MRERILGLIAFRLAVAAVLLATAASSEIVLDAPILTPFMQVALGSIFATALIQIMLVFSGVVSPIAAKVQVGLDLLMLAGVVWVTGGPLSPFAFLFCLIVLEAALALQRQATMTTAVTASIVLIGINGGNVQAVSVTAGQVAAVLSLGFLASALMQQAQAAKSELLRLGNLHERVLLGLSSGIITTDKRGRIDFANPAGLSILKRTGDIVGTALSDVSSELGELTPEQLDRGEVEVRVENRTLVLGLSAVPLFDAHNVVVGHTLIFRDLTSIRLAERERQRHSQLAIVGGLAANLAHEVRNPLGAVSGSIDMIAQNPRLEPDERHLVRIVQREVERLNSLIADFLEYARPQASERVHYDVASLADEVVHLFSVDPAAATHRISRTGVVAGAFALVDTGQVRQILINLLKNAVQAAQPGTLVELNVQMGVVLSVWNEGAPITDVERIFEPFFTTKLGGTGLGLPLVHQLVRQNAGDIRVRHEGGRVGFVIELPAA